MCAPCKVVLNEIDQATAEGASLHAAVNRGVSKVLDQLPDEVQNKLSSIDVHYIRNRMEADRAYFESLVAVLSNHAGVKFGD